MDKSNRIFFKDNPYPKGHKIKQFRWSGRFVPKTGFWFDFDLITEDYYAEHDAEENTSEIDFKSNWYEQAAWANYHKSSIYSERINKDGGLLVGSEDNSLDFENLDSRTIKVDTLDSNKEFDEDESSFGIYLLGHDSCANHKITFVKKYSKSIYDIEWSGNIALSYSGDYEFKYRFDAYINKAIFEGFSFEGEISNEEFSKYLVNPQLFEINEKIIKVKT